LSKINKDEPLLILIKGGEKVEKGRSIQVKMEKLLTDSSKLFVDRFLTDEADEANAFAQAKEFSERLQLAAAYKGLANSDKTSKKSRNALWMGAKEKNEWEASHY